MLLPNLPLGLSLLIFLGCAGAIWVAGIFLSNYTDVLAERLHLGSALGGLVLLAVATNLPEVAITTRRSEPDLRPVSPPVVEYPPRALRGTVIIRGDIVKPSLADHEIDLERDHV